MKLPQTLLTAYLTFLTLLSFNSWGDTDLPNKPVKVTFETFEEDLNNHASTLDYLELGMQRLVTIKGYFVNKGVTCPYTSTGPEKFIGTKTDGSPNIFRDPDFKQENQDPNCADYNPEIKMDALNVKTFLEGKEDYLSNTIIVKIEDSKYLIKTFDSETGTYLELTFDLKKPFFLNPVETEMFQNENGDIYKEKAKLVVTQLP